MPALGSDANPRCVVHHDLGPFEPAAMDGCVLQCHVALVLSHTYPISILLLPTRVLSRFATAHYRAVTRRLGASDDGGTNDARSPAGGPSFRIIDPFVSAANRQTTDKPLSRRGTTEGGNCIGIHSTWHTGFSCALVDIISEF